MSGSASADRIEAILGRVLGAGSALSTALLAIGLLLTIAVPAAPATAFTLRTGLLILMATPMARVLVATIAYSRAREWSSTLMAGTVLLVLLGSVVIAILE
jgi:uncharacterized membrane protein